MAAGLTSGAAECARVDGRAAEVEREEARVRGMLKRARRDMMVAVSVV